MFDFFKSKKDNKDLDAKSLRNSILQFIKEELQCLDGGEGKRISVISLYMAVIEEQRYLYETAVYYQEPTVFKDEVQRIAENYALALPADWKLELQFLQELPPGAIPAEGLSVSLGFKSVSASAAKTSKAVTAQVKVVKGYAEQETYLLNTSTGRINIGRESSVQANDGSFRLNQIAFPEDPLYENNKYISRQHAHIEWDSESGNFKIYADEGGVPPGNKTKIRTAADESVKKLNSTQIGHILLDRDQIILGDAAVLEVSILT